MWFSRVPLARLNLTHDKRRLVLSLAGICFAVLLMLMEVGFRHALYDSVVELVHKLDADLIVANKAKFSLVGISTFPRQRLYQALEVTGVATAAPLYIEMAGGQWKNPDREAGDPATRPIRVLAFDPADNVLLIPEVQAQLYRLALPDSALLDLESKRFFGRRAAGIERELARRRLHILGTFSLGTDFAIDGNLIMSDRTFAKFFPQRGFPAAVDLGLLKLAPGSDPATVRAAVQTALPEDVMVLTKEEFVQQESDYWSKANPIDAIFGLGLVMGFVIGTVICYQILATDVADYMAEYATLKAIGYRNRFLTKVVLQEALWLAVLGFVPGVVLGWFLYEWLKNWTGLPMRLTPPRGGLVLILTVVMCTISGIFALRRVQTADPAEVF
jgi:putative ABC transport system permease protein